MFDSEPKKGFSNFADTYLHLNPSSVFKVRQALTSLSLDTAGGRKVDYQSDLWRAVALPGRIGSLPSEEIAEAEITASLGMEVIGISLEKVQMARRMLTEPANQVKAELMRELMSELEGEFGKDGLAELEGALQSYNDEQGLFNEKIKEN